MPRQSLIRWVNMRKFKRTIKRVWEYLIAIFSLPHFLTVLCLMISALISLKISYHYRNEAAFLSSVFSNIFAGLITGIAVCLISGIKNITTYSLEGKIRWLNSVHSDCLKFNQHYREVLQKVAKDDISDEELYDEIYDVLCDGNNIAATIAQSQYDKKLAFNPYKYFLKRLKFDAVEQMKKNNETRDKVMNIDMSMLTHKQLREIFDEMEHSLFTLNAAILSKIKDFEIKQNISNKFIF